MKIFIPKLKLEEKEINFKFISFVKSYLTATYKTNPRKFKIRNRIILINTILFSIIYFNIEEPKKEILIENKYKLEVKKEIEIANEQVNRTEIEKILNEQKQETEENIKNYYIQVVAIYKLEYFKDNFDKLDSLGYEYTIKDYKTKKGSIIKKVLVGPYATFEDANDKLEFINKQLNVKGFVKNIQKREE